MKPAAGLSGGLVLIWDPNFFLIEDKIEGDGFLLVKGVWLSSGKKLGIFNIYAPHSKSRNKALWSVLLSLILPEPNYIRVALWDFNEVRCREECLGSRFSQSGANNLNAFIDEGDLSEIKCGGRKYTRFSKDGTQIISLCS